MKFLRTPFLIKRLRWLLLLFVPSYNFFMISVLYMAFLSLTSTGLKSLLSKFLISTYDSKQNSNFLLKRTNNSIIVHMNKHIKKLKLLEKKHASYQILVNVFFVTFIFIIIIVIIIITIIITLFVINPFTFNFYCLHYYHYYLFIFLFFISLYHMF